MTTDEPGTDRTTGVRVATPDDAAVVVEILVGAFHHDPLWSWAFPDDAARAEQHREFWGLFVEGGLRYPWTFLTDGDTATSLWIPPGGSELTEEVEPQLEQRLLGIVGPGGVGRVMAAMTALDDAHPHDRPHLHLSLLGTRPDQRGQGYGLGLLAANLRRVDAAGLPAYLEASNLGNVALYGRYGFEPLRTVAVPGGPDVVTMWREPRPEPGAATA